MIVDETFLIGLLQIIGIDILLSGDNALVIALACRSLPPNLRRWGIVGGTAAAIVLRIVFAGSVVYLMQVPYLKLVGSALLFWIAVKFVVPEEHQAAGEHGGGHEVRAAGSLSDAIRVIVIADAVMSLDNVVAVAAAAKGSVVLLALGIAISIPLMVCGSAIMLRLLDRYPWLIPAGGALLGWIAGGLAIHDPVMAGWPAAQAPLVAYGAPALGALAVVAVGLLLVRRQRGGRAGPEPDGMSVGGEGEP